MTTRDEDELWRSIVENYGERAVLDDSEPESPATGGPEDHLTSGPEDHAADGTGGTTPTTPSRSPLLPGPEPAPAPAPREGFVPFGPEDGTVEPEPAAASEDPEVGHDDGHRFVPPDPPLPTMDRKRWIAWAAVLGSPAAFVLTAILDVTLDGLVAALLALIFVGGFGYLVATMPKGPADPWDDGARV